MAKRNGNMQRRSTALVDSLKLEHFKGLIADVLSDIVIVIATDEIMELEILFEVFLAHARMK